MSLSGAQTRRITEALCTAFPSRADLARMVTFGLGVNLSAISPETDLVTTAFALVQWAEAQGRLPALYDAAHQANTSFPLTLADFAPIASTFQFTPPALPATFVPRPTEYRALRDAILAPDSTQPVALTTTLHGAGGFGKTTLAAALCADPAVQAAFPDGIVWVTLGETPDVVQLLAALAVQVLGHAPATAVRAEVAAALAAGWAGRRVLLVVDDAWTAGDLEALLRAGQPCTRLATTRILTLVHQCRAIRLDEMATREAAALLAAHLVDPPADLAVLDPLARQLGEWPLLLDIVGPVLQENILLGDTLAQALAFVQATLREEGVTAFRREVADERATAVAITLAVSLGRLTAEERARYLELAIFPEDQPIPLAVVADLWGITAFQTERAAKRLAALSLLRYEADTQSLRLHDVIREYLAGQLVDSVAVHARLLSAWGDLHHFRAEVAPYAWRWAGYHLQGAGQADRWRALRLEYGWLAAKLAMAGVAALVADFEETGVDSALDQVGGALRLALPALLADPQLLAGQLRGRLLNSPAPAARALAAAAVAPYSWLRPLTQSLLPPNPALQHTLADHTDAVQAVAVTGDGLRAVSASEDGTLRVWNLATGENLYTLAGHTDAVRAVALTGDGQRAVSASWDHTLRVWDLATGQILYTLAGHTDAVRAVAVTGDGQRSISASADKTLRVWDLASGRALYTLRGHIGGVYAVAVTDDGQRAVSASADKTLRVWDLTSGQILHILADHTQEVRAVAVTGDGQRAISASVDETLRVWDLATGQSLHTLVGHTDVVWAVAVTGDGQRAVSASGDCTLRIWDLATGQALHTLAGHIFEVVGVVVTRDGRRAVSASRDGLLRVWDLASGQLFTTLRGHADEVRAVAVMGDGQRAVSASNDGTLRVWNLTTGQVLPTLAGHADLVMAVAVTGDGRRAVSASYDRTLRVWDLATGQALHTLAGHTRGVNAVAVTGDGLRAISASNDGTLRVWDLVGGQALHTLTGHTAPVAAVAVTGDGQRAVSASWDNTLRVWNLASGRALYTLIGHIGPVYAVAVTGDGQRAVSASWDQTLRVWDLASGQTLHTLRGHTTWVDAVAVTSDGQRVVSASGDSTLRVWDLASGQALHTLRGHTDPVRTVALTGDGRCAVSASDDKTLRVWDLTSSQALHTLAGHTKAVWEVTLTPNGQHVVSASDDGTLRRWDLTTGQLLTAFVTNGPLNCCTYALDGDLIIAGDNTGQVHFLRLEGAPAAIS